MVWPKDEEESGGYGLAEGWWLQVVLERKSAAAGGRLAEGWWLQVGRPTVVLWAELMVGRCGRKFGELKFGRGRW